MSSFLLPPLLVWILKLEQRQGKKLFEMQKGSGTSCSRRRLIESSNIKYHVTVQPPRKYVRMLSLPFAVTQFTEILYPADYGRIRFELKNE